MASFDLAPDGEETLLQFSFRALGPIDPELLLGPTTRANLSPPAPACCGSLMNPLGRKAAGRLNTSMSAPRPSLPPRAVAAFTNEIPADRRYWVLGAVMLVQFTSILTSTIVSTAAPTIVDELRGLDLYAWLFSSYMLASSVTVPVVGKLSDLFGRRPFYIAGLMLFLVGSAVSGLSQSMVELIAASRRHRHRRRRHDGAGRDDDW